MEAHHHKSLLHTTLICALSVSDGYGLIHSAFNIRICRIRRISGCLSFEKSRLPAALQPRVVHFGTSQARPIPSPSSTQAAPSPGKTQTSNGALRDVDVRRVCFFSHLPEPVVVALRLVQTFSFPGYFILTEVYTSTCLPYRRVLLFASANHISSQVEACLLMRVCLATVQAQNAPQKVGNPSPIECERLLELSRKLEFKQTNIHIGISVQFII